MIENKNSREYACLCNGCICPRGSYKNCKVDKEKFKLFSGKKELISMNENEWLMKTGNYKVQKLRENYMKILIINGYRNLFNQLGIVIYKIIDSFLFGTYYSEVYYYKHGMESIGIKTKQIVPSLFDLTYKYYDHPYCLVFFLKNKTIPTVIDTKNIVNLKKAIKKFKLKYGEIAIKTFLLVREKLLNLNNSTIYPRKNAMRENSIIRNIVSYATTNNENQSKIKNINFLLKTNVEEPNINTDSKNILYLMNNTDKNIKKIQSYNSWVSYMGYFLQKIIKLREKKLSNSDYIIWSVSQFYDYICINKVKKYSQIIFEKSKNRMKKQSWFNDCEDVFFPRCGY